MLLKKTIERWLSSYKRELNQRPHQLMFSVSMILVRRQRYAFKGRQHMLATPEEEEGAHSAGTCVAVICRLLEVPELKRLLKLNFVKISLASM